MRDASMRSTRRHTDDSAIGSASSTKPGLMPVPRMLTPCSLASASNRSAHSGSVAHGYASVSAMPMTLAPALHRRLDLVGDLVQVARREDAHDVGLLREHRREVGGHGDVAVAADRLADGAPVLLGMPVDDADEVDLLRTIEDVAEKPLAHHARAPHRNLDHASLPVRRNPEIRSRMHTIA